MQRAHLAMLGSPSKRWLMLKKANTHAKARTSARVKAAAKPATTVAKARTPAKAKGVAPLRGADRPVLRRQPALRRQAEISARVRKCLQIRDLCQESAYRFLESRSDDRKHKVASAMSLNYGELFSLNFGPPLD